tara:strand:- start:20 stop:325 length:306 start_codon:yes stop_codon:yes gene_type:complete
MGKENIMSVTRPLYNATANGNVEFTEAEYAEYEASLPQVEVSYQEHLKRTVRAERDVKLAETDWTASTDVTMTAEMTAYRQALRDVPAQAGFPNTIDWPEV